MIVEFCSTGVLAGLVLLIYLAFFWKINWIRDLTVQNSRSLFERYKIKKNRQIGKLPPIYPNGWFGLLESSALKKGQVEHVAALGENFAVFRTENGTVRILNAYCLHLGANMAEGGQVVGEELECPFHSWRFCGKTGKCTSIPYSKTVPETIKTKAWESLEVNGIIFVWYHAEFESPDWWPRQILKISNGNWKYQGRNEFYVNCHIQEIPENGADWAHLSAVHGPFLLAANFISKMAHHAWSNIAWTSNSAAGDSPPAAEGDPEEEADPGRGEESKSHVAVSRLKHRLVLFERFSVLQLNVEATQVGPGYVELHIDTSFGPMCIIQTVTPLQPLLQRVTHLMYAPLLMAPYSRIVLIGESIMFERDVLVWNHKKYTKSPTLVSEDRTIKAYRRWYKQFYSESSPTYNSCRNSIAW